MASQLFFDRSRIFCFIPYLMLYMVAVVSSVGVKYLLPVQLNRRYTAVGWKIVILTAAMHYALWSAMRTHQFRSVSYRMVLYCI